MATAAAAWPSASMARASSSTSARLAKATTLRRSRAVSEAATASAASRAATILSPPMLPETSMQRAMLSGGAARPAGAPPAARSATR